MCGHGRQANRVAIRCGFGHQIGAQIATGTGFVFHNHRAQGIFDALGQCARCHIQRPTRCVRHDQTDGFALCPSGQGGECGGTEQK